MQSFGCVLKRRCTERCTFSENLPEGWNGGTALEKKQEDGRFCRAYLRTMDPEQAAAEIGRRDGYAMLGQKGTQQKLERMRCDAAAQLKREDVLRQLARLAFGRVDDAVTLALRRGETEPEGLELSAVSELRVTENRHIAVILCRLIYDIAEHINRENPCIVSCQLIIVSLRQKPVYLSRIYFPYGTVICVCFGEFK